MKTLTATKARQNIGSVLHRALNGEDIGILLEGKIVALRPVEVYSKDYAWPEYGMTRAQIKRAERNILRKLKHEKARRWDGTVKGLRG